MLSLIWINIGIYSTTIAWTIIGLVIAPIAFTWFRFGVSLSKSESTQKLIWIYGHIWVRIISLFIPVSLSHEKIPSPCIFVANHTSFFDMYFVGIQPCWNVCFVVRDWPFRIPFYRPFMKMAKYIRIGTDSLDKVVKKSKEIFKNDASVFFFPEGTRSTDGSLTRFHSGAFYVSLETGVPIIPLCIAGTHQLLPKGKWLLKQAKVEVRLLPPVYPDTYQLITNGHVKMRKDVKEGMARALQEMAGAYKPNSRS